MFEYKLMAMIVIVVLFATMSFLGCAKSSRNPSKQSPTKPTATSSPSKQADNSEEGSFTWALKNPKAFDEWAEDQHKKSAEGSKPLSAKEISNLIQQLKDPKLLEPTQEKVHSLDDYPFEAILNRLDPYAPPELVPVIAPLVHHKTEWVRKAVALALGSIGNDDCLSPLSVCLADSEDYVRDYAMMGIGRALEANRAKPAFRKGIFEKIIPLIDRKEQSASGDAPRLLLRLDRDRAAKILTGERYMTVKNDQLYHSLEALNEARILLPPKTLRELMKALRPKWEEYPYSYAYAQCLMAAGLSKAPEAEKVIREGMTAKESIVFTTAAEALLALNGLPSNTWQWLIERIKRDGFDSLTPDQKNCIFVFELDSEVDNGGFSQYFFNSSGDDAMKTLQALKTIGDNHSANVLAKAIALFGPSGPSRNRSQRMEQLSKFSKEQEKILGKCDDEFYKNTDRWECLIAEYTLKHKAEFAESKPKP